MMLDMNLDTELERQDIRDPEGDVKHGSVDYFDFDWGTEGMTSAVLLRGCGNACAGLPTCRQQCGETEEPTCGETETDGVQPDVAAPKPNDPDPAPEAELDSYDSSGYPIVQI